MTLTKAAAGSFSQLLVLSLLVERIVQVVRILASARPTAWEDPQDPETSVPANTPTESVHPLHAVVPATWATGSSDGLRELQQCAGHIPEAPFSIDPTRLKLRLHGVYARLAMISSVGHQRPCIDYSSCPAARNELQPSKRESS
jgi:hypothetical protein